MNLLSLILWWMGLALEFVILVRGLQTRMVAKYPYFYAYVFCVFGVSTGLYIGLRLSHGFYNRWYWPTQFATLIIGCGVILEILQQALESYAGAQRFLRTLCLAIVVVASIYVVVKIMSGSLSNFEDSAAVERDLRTVQAIFLAIVLAVVFYYRVSFGRNVKGFVIGFGTYVGISMMALAIFAVFGQRFQKTWGFLQSGAYLFALSVWTVTLWSYAPNSVPRRGRSDPDYRELSGQTRDKLEALRNHFNRTARQ